MPYTRRLSETIEKDLSAPSRVSELSSSGSSEGLAYTTVELEDIDACSEEFLSLGLDSILSSDLSSLAMRGQSSKPSKKSKNRSSTSSIIPHGGGLDNHPRRNGEIGSDQEDPLAHVPPNEFSASDLDADEDIVSDLIRSVQLANHTTASNVNSERRPSNATRSFLLIDESETIQVSSGEELLHKLGCMNAQVKVISIFGNTGDGKSYTLNHAFFGGQEVFATSADQDTCTVGVWTAYDPDTKVMCVDTEGLLGVTKNQNKRTRLLLKILAVSDVIIYRTAADRLHTDLFQFLGDASQAYSKHFRQELELRKSHAGHRLLQEMGPAVIVFHETKRTNTLDASAKGKSGDEILRERFVSQDVDISSFSSIKYVGVKTTRNPTNFAPLISSLKKEIANCSVRSPRSPLIVYEMLKILNDKFKGDIYSHSPNSFPDEFFTCASKCLACTNRCSLSMNHRANHHFAGACKYVHTYDNRSYICKRCLEKGRKNEVVPKTCASDDNSIVGVAKYMLAGYVLECRECGVIYKSREHWYGNKEPTESAVQTEIKHIWPGQAGMPTATHNAAWKLLDGVKVVADTVSAYSSKPTKLLSDWVADQVAPSYWVPNNDVINCHSCHHKFSEHEKKHHCRSCGSGFCDDCTQFSKPVPERGWGPSPVRVCEKCHSLPPGTVVLGAEGATGEPNSLVPRQIVENMQSVLGAVASVAIDYPIDFIKDSARPTYWIPDHLIKTCHQCQAEFGPKLTIHHCRACGHGVCNSCSANQRQVPSRGWDRAVRVCDNCYKKEGGL
ncbi:zinc finger FYVE domain-containing protein 1-like [Watersipora subatra]|uniref:zinc finger FYVE domain-containing protein 1-like n=1 Tax=Watersipora subatra TaxID=2589382 RepID=UPI00355B49E6